MKKIDWGMVLPLSAFVVVIALGLVALGRGFVKHHMYVYDFSAPISWGAVVTTFAIIYLSVVEMFLFHQIITEIIDGEPIRYS